MTFRIQSIARICRRWSRLERILGIHPFSGGFGYAVLETRPLRLIAWGEVPCQEYCTKKAQQLINETQPSVVLLELNVPASNRRCHYSTNFLRNLSRYAKKKAISTLIFLRALILRAFSRQGVQTELEMDRQIEGILPDILPSRRDRKSEPSPVLNMSVINALAIIFTYLSIFERSK